METNLSSSASKKLLVFSLIMLLISLSAMAQNLYTARGYWQESTKPSYLTIKEKKDKGQALTTDEEAYVQDYEAYFIAGNCLFDFGWCVFGNL